ncbi:hypothetical protein DMC47_39060 [Nostoc sp. 3335mG]|nr:hypothetical protein DMC47_39060 [Nostoc sp. 3335mG]
MTIRVDQGVIFLEGRCRIEEAETLLGHLLEDGDRPVDLSGCEALHSAVVQILMAAKPVISRRPIDSFLCAHILPLLETERSPSGPAPL